MWTWLPILNDWNGQEWGFCQKDKQCFIPNSDPSKTINNFNIDLLGANPVTFPQCLNNSEYLLDHYCDQGNWTSRTKFLAAKLLEVAKDVADDEVYSIYCTDLRDAFIDKQELDDKKERITGALLSSQPPGQQTTGGTTGASLGTTLLGDKAESGLICFSQLQGEKPLVDDSENTCVNNVCILRYKDGEQMKTALATSLNKPADNENSFLPALIEGIDVQNSCGNAISGKFSQCQLGESTLADNSLWYSKDLNAVIFARDGLPVESTGITGAIDRLVIALKNLLGISSSLSEEEKFVSKAQNYRELFLLSSEQGKKVRAIKEIFPEKQTLVAEFEDFETVVCDYTKPNRLNFGDFGTEGLEELQGRNKMVCTKTGQTQKVEVIGKTKDLKQLWPQLTGMLRVQ